jgi:hypothetical protein
MIFNFMYDSSEVVRKIHTGCVYDRTSNEQWIPVRWTYALAVSMVCRRPNGIQGLLKAKAIW